MKASELSKKFLIWWQNENPEGKIHRNNRGIAKIGKRFVRFGIPTPTGRGKNEKLKGSDYFAFVPYKYATQWIDGHNLIVKFYEIKTKTDVLSEGQINFLNMMTKMGADCFVVHEAELTDFEKSILTIRECDKDKMTKDFWIEKWSVK